MELTDDWGVVSRPYSRLAVGSSLIRQLLVRKQAHISFARTKIILARAIFDEIHGVRSNFLHGLPVELRTVGVSFPPRVAGKGS